MDDSNYMIWEQDSDSNFNEIIENVNDMDDQVEGYEEVDILHEPPDDDEAYFIDADIHSSMIPAPAQDNLIYLNDDKLVNKTSQLGVGRSHLIEQRVEEAENKIIGDRDAQEEYPTMVVEEVIAGGWSMESEDMVQVAMEQVVTSDNHYNEEDSEIVPLNTDQDEYTTQRPYPCDFCSRRFRKKANLMNHIISHQNVRPHMCNLCGSRYVRKCDLINHLKIHAYNIGEDSTLPSTSGKKKPKFDHDELDFMNDTYDDVPDDDDFDYNHYSKPQVQEKIQVSTKNKKQKVKPKAKQQPMKFEKLTKSKTVPKEISITTFNRANDDDEEDDHLNGKNHINEYIEKYPITDPRKPFVCQHCGCSFTREKALESHTKIHNSHEPTFECEVCGDSFYDNTALEEHLELRHNFSSRIRRTGGKSTSGKTTSSAKVLELMDEDDDSNSEYDPDKNDDSSAEDDEEDVGYTCDQCDISFKTTEQFKRHIRIHGLIKEEMNSDDDIDVKKKDSLCNDCNVCGESFTEPLDLLAHAEIHARYQPFKCQLCGQTFFEENNIKQHLMNNHGGELTDSSCRLCGKQCRDQRSLIKHSWEHSREKNHPCSKCGKTFHNKARLKRHISSHRNKSVICEVCHEEFPDGRQLMNHRHSHTKANQFPCHECGKTFGSRSSQQIHIRIHTGERPYGCRYCWKAFADGGTLRKHERIHTGEKPYCCLVCPRAFNQRVVLREHIRSHHSGPDPVHGTSTSPYYCSLCGDLFTASIDLIQHLIEHSDKSTAAKRVQPSGPRKYKRRRKINGDSESIEFNSNNGIYPRIKSEQEAPMIKKTNIFSKIFKLPESPSLFNLPEDIFHSTGQKVPDRKSLSPAQHVKSAKMIFTQKSKVVDGKRKSKTMIERQVVKPTIRLTQRQLEKQRKLMEKAKEKEQEESDDGNTSETWSNDDPNEDVLHTLIKRERKLSEKYTIDLVNDLQEILRSPIKTNDESPSTSSQPQRRSGRQNIRKLGLDDSREKIKQEGFCCEICSDSFETRVQLQNHVQIHIG